MISYYDLQKLDEIVAIIVDAKSNANNQQISQNIDVLLKRLLNIRSILKISVKSDNIFDSSFIHQLHSSIISMDYSNNLLGLENIYSQYKNQMNEFYLSLVDNHNVESIIKSEIDKLSINIFSSTKINDEIARFEKLQPKIKTTEDKIKNIEIEVESLISKKAEIKQEAMSKSFNLKSTKLSGIYAQKALWLIYERVVYLVLGLAIAAWLGISYYNAFTNPEYKLNDFISLFIVRIPFIFISIWAFFEIARVTRLHEYYIYKAHLAFTVDELIALVEKYDKQKVVITSFIIETLSKLNDLPISKKEKSENIRDTISELKSLIKDNMGLIRKLNSE